MGHVMYLRKGSVHTAPSIIPALANATPAMIQEVARSGRAPNVWAVGDTVPIELDGTVGALTFNKEIYYAFIIGFDHNPDIEGTNTIHFQFGKTADGVDIAFCDSNYGSADTTTAFRMNTFNTNSGGWNNSYMRMTICPAFLSAMPADWQSVIASCTKYSDNTGGGNDTASYVTATSDKIWLLAEFEVFGSTIGANSAEQTKQQQYDYYKAGNSRVKYKHKAVTTTCQWWLRSVYIGNTTRFRYVLTTGDTSNALADGSLGFAPGFKVA